MIKEYLSFTIGLGVITGLIISLGEYITECIIASTIFWALMLITMLKN
jgi:hypothetical protein